MFSTLSTILILLIIINAIDYHFFFNMDIRSVISRGDTITIKKGVKHAVRAISELTFIEVQSGNLLAEEDIEQFDYKW